jgi:hypothetical protein
MGKQVSADINEVNLHKFLVSALDGSTCLPHHPAAYPLQKDPSYQSDRRMDGSQGHVDLVAKKKKKKKSLQCLESNTSRPVRNQILYWLNYPVSDGREYLRGRPTFCVLPVF